ncbi:uncharacterized protein LOC132731935 [Ruditapes philippinarum]|uniref:uncharacterized protein LOC132731935 n=1 Tax=Ruditapes philippinarum TaxID=129788 RepID=UPI00295A9C7F|nr:uncharacterized protein LOC132731935 [Ruditapes philippinarum]
MSAETPSEDGEIHDLVLLFANSKIPRGSDAFQTLIDDFLKHDDDVTDANDDVTTSDSSDSSTKPETISVEDVAAVPKSVLKAKKKSVRMESPKHLSHVHWPDEENSKLASSPGQEQLHHARLYMKTTPKPILKHDESVLVPSSNEKHYRRFSTPPHI